MTKTIKQSKLSRQAEAMELYSNGFSKNEIAEMLGVNRSTVTRYFYSPTRAEVEDFSENYAYGAYYTNGGEVVPFNRRYKPLSDKARWVTDIVRKEWYYQDNTPWCERVYNSTNKFVVYRQDENYTCHDCGWYLQEREMIYQSRIDGSTVCRKCYEKSLSSL